LDNEIFHKVTQGSYYMIIDQAINYILGFLFWLVLAKLTVPAVLGQVMLTTAIAGIVLGFAGYGAQVTISKYVAEYNAKGMTNISKSVFALGLKIGLIVIAIAATASVLFSSQLAAAFSSDSSLVGLIIVAMLIFLPSQTIIACFNGAFQGSHKMKYTALTDLIYQVSRLFITVVLIILGFESLGVLLGFAFGSVIATICAYSLFLRKLFNNVTGTGSPTNLRHVVRFSVFNYLSIGLSTLSIQIGYLLLGIQSFDSVAVFGISALMSGVVGGIMVSVSRAIIPSTSEQWQKEDKTGMNIMINTAFRLSIIASGFLYILLIIAPEQILTLLSDKYSIASSSLQILVVAAIISSLTGLFVSVLNGIGKPKYVAKIGVISSIALIASSIVLIPLLRVEGAALSVFNGSLVGISLSLYYFKKEHILKISYGSLLKPVVSILLSLVVGFGISAITGNILAALISSAMIYTMLIRTLRLVSYSEISGLVHIATKSIRLK